MLTSRDAPTFDVHLDVFTGPFDLLLGLVARHRLDLSDVALAEVTDEFIAHVRRLGSAAQELGQLSGFLLVAATLLDLKAARLLPVSAPEDPEDVALLEARDLLFARLLQHRAYAEVAAVLGAWMAREGVWVARAVPLEEHLVSRLPPLQWTTTPEQLAALARSALAPAPPPRVATDHLHAPTVSVAEQVALLTALLADAGALSFAAIVADAEGGGSIAQTPVVVGRFLAVLELYRRGQVDLEQSEPLTGLLVRWRPDAPDPSGAA